MIDAKQGYSFLEDFLRRGILDDDCIQLLPARTFKTLVNLAALFDEEDGGPLDLEYVAFRLRMPVARLKREALIFHDLGLFPYSLFSNLRRCK